MAPIVALNVNIGFSTGSGPDDPGDPDDPGTDDFADHNGPKTTIALTENNVTTNYTVPYFMKGFVKDTSWTGEGVRFCCPWSGRQFRTGQFNNDAFARYGQTGQHAFHGSNLIGYALDKGVPPIQPNSEYGRKATTTWERIAGGPKDPDANGNYSSPNVGTKFFPNCLQGHQNLGAFRETCTAANMADNKQAAVGIYMTTLPFGTATAADVAAAINPQATYVDQWYKAFAVRLKNQAAIYGNPVVIIRPNWEAMNQDTGMKLQGFQQWFEAGYNQKQYNAMMRKFCRIVKQFGPPGVYIVFSPAFESTVVATQNKSYDSWLTDNPTTGVVGDADWVGYNGTCASCHPDAVRNTSLARAHGLIDGVELPNNVDKWHYTQRAINASIKYKIPFFSLEIGPSVPFTNASRHDVNPGTGSKFYGDTFAKLGPIVNQRNMYGLIGAFGFLDQGGILFPGSATGNSKASMPSFWTSDDKDDMDRCSKIIRKYWGKKSIYDSATIPPYANRTD